MTLASHLSRRETLQAVTAAGALAAAGLIAAPPPAKAASDKAASDAQTASNGGGFWPNGARLAVSLSLMFEGGGQPISGAGGVIPDPIEKGVPDLPTNAFFAYGHYEGIPRLLDLMDKHGIKLSSFMIGKAVETSPDIAREIVRRGHEAAAHGRIWSNSYQLPKDQEKRFIADGVETIQKITGQTPIGWNAYWMRNSVHILETLQDLGFLYHIDEPSHDEPFIVPVRGKDFVTVPYTMHMNDIVSFPFQGWNPAAYEQALKDEFDQLYEEGAKRRRMMVISLHDRISGHAGRARVLDRFLSYAKSKGDVWFARKDEIARYALANRANTPVIQRASPSATGLPGPTA
ncbi:polysaccharide deacetylase family protein [Bradyrhizobium sp. CCBAU 53421]|uniref:polysaccharide deacetylase family protein n=1 Tax=Bradyrhizobium sp. CCBAU 53421 TaxID=1325120 RepID=UPI00188BBFC0|nr:polysaccharide deacetylase family protein [Bradyrhizobium sp. CCBAU 53421]QOZ37415.1 polysaccharide deacetylase [Bradyrhizobium sp. CCBAU 53421]